MCNVQCAWRGILLKQLQIWSSNWAYWTLSKSLQQLIIDGVTWALSVDLTAIITHLNVVSWVNSVDPQPPHLVGLMRTSCGQARQGKARQALPHKCSHSCKRPSHPHKVLRHRDHNRGLGIYYWSCELSEIFWAVIFKLILDFVRWHYS